LVGLKKFVWSFGFFTLKKFPLKENIAIQFVWETYCKIFVTKAILDRFPRSDVSKIWGMRDSKWILSTKQAQRLLTGLRLRDKNATVSSTKWKGSYDSGRKYRSESEMTFAWVQKAADGSVCKLWQHCTQTGV